MDFLGLHPYLVANIPVLFIILLTARFCLSPDNRKGAVRSGLYCVPAAIFSRFHEVDYWHPLRVGGIVPGAEDLIFCFNAGAIAWMAVALKFRDRMSISTALGTALRRYAVVSLGCFVLFLGIRLAGVSSMAATVIMCGSASVVLMILRKNLRHLAATGVIGFTPVYIIIVGIQFWIWPNYVKYWIADGPWAWTILGFPVGEIVWAIAFASFWPVFMGFLWDAGLNRCEESLMAG